MKRKYTKKYDRYLGRSNRVLYSEKTAAIYIGLSVNVLRKLVKEGFFFPIELGNKIMFDRDDLDVFLNARIYRDSEKFRINQTNFNLMVTKIERMTQKLRAVEKVLNMYYEPLILEDKQLVGLYLTIKEIFNEKDPPDLETWGDILCRLDVSHFERLTLLVPEDKLFWRHFLDFSYALMFACKWKAREKALLINRAYENIKGICILYLTANKLSINPHESNKDSIIEKTFKVFKLIKSVNFFNKEMEAYNEANKNEVKESLRIPEARRGSKFREPQFTGENIEEIEE